MSKVFGIDVSKWQGNFNFEKAMNEGVKFAILRGAYANSKDSKFEQFYATCKALKLPVGVYHYSMAKTVNEAIEEANFLISNVLKGKQFEYPIYMDVEDESQRKLSKKLLTDIVIAYCKTLEKAGYYVGIYSSKSFFGTHLDTTRLISYDKWVAQWSKSCTYKGAYGMWQFGGETNAIRTNKVAGVTCDQDYALKDYPKIIKNAKRNGYTGTSVESKPKPVKKKYGGVFPNITVTYYVTNKWGKRVKKKRYYLTKGDNGTQVSNLQRFLNWYGNYKLAIDGDFGNKTLSAVKDFQKDNKLEVDGYFGKKSLAKAKTIKK